MSNAEGLEELTEYEQWTGDLSADDAQYLAAQLGSTLSIKRNVNSGKIEIDPHQFVGLLTLPSGRRLRISPKIPARNLFRMLASAYELPSPFREEPAATAALDEVLEFVVEYFVDRVQERIDRGLYREYVEREENLPVVKGRIVFADDIRANFALRQRTWCRFGELTWDVPDNQVLRQVANLLAGWGFSTQLTSRLGRIVALLDEVSDSRFVSDDLAGFRYHRHNDDYWELHQLCRIFLEFSSPNEDVGPVPLRSFLIDMNVLFERFVEQQFRLMLKRPWSVEYQSHAWLAEGGRVLLKPDLVIRRGNKPQLVLDCKYKRLETGRYKNHDLYQVLAYCTALGLNVGTLIYPRHLTTIDEMFRVQNSTVALSQISLDLSGHWLEVLDGVRALVDDVMGRLLQSQVAA